MIASLDQTEVIALATLGLLYLIALLMFVLAVWRGKLQPIWRRIRVGFFVERNGISDHDKEEK